MKFELLEKNQVKFTFEVNPADFQHALEAAYEQVKDKSKSKDLEKEMFLINNMLINMVLNHYMKTL